MVDTLAASYPSVPTIYFYCNYEEVTWQTTSSIVKSLLKQLLTKFRSLDSKLLDAFNNDTSLSLKTTEELFAASLLQLETTFIIVDALDECSQDERRCLVGLLKRLLILKCNIKIFLTSRDEDDLREIFMDNSSYRINVHDTATDITPFITAKIDDLIQKRQILDGNVSPMLREDLIKTIGGQADGMYVLDQVGNYTKSAGFIWKISVWLEWFSIVLVLFRNQL